MPRAFKAAHSILPALLTLFASAVSVAPAISAQERAPTASITTTPRAATDPSPFAALRWRSIGPVNTSGRVDDFAVGRKAGQPDQLYVATASGGVFKSVNGGTSWFPVFDKVDAMMSIGDVTVAPSDVSVVWVGTGEANNRQSSSWGDGVYKSVDAGHTWTNMGLKDTRHIARIVIDPSNADIVYVAAVGHLWGPNADRGVFKSSDGGRTWSKVLFVDDNTGATDLVMDPGNSQVLYAATYQRQRKAWGFNGGGPGSGIYKTSDGGATWTRLTNGLPSGDKGRIGLDIFRGDSRVVYATIEAGGGPAGRSVGGAGPGGGRGAAGRGAGGRGAAGEGDGGVYRSSDGGMTWERLTSLNPRPMYYSQIRVDPKDANRVYLLGSNRGFYISDDGGRNFQEPFSNIHSEDHAFWIDPDDPHHVIVGGDGGVSISWDRAATWDFRRNMPIGQFYEVDVDNRIPFTICGGLQDNGVWCVPSAVRNRNGIADRDAWNIGGGDGFHAHVDPTDPNFAFEESQNGNVARVNLLTLERQNVRPIGPDRPRTGNGAYRWNWDTPILVSRADPKVMYMGANVLFRSADRGSSWKVISPDLTARVDRDTLQLMGSRVPPQALSRHDGQSNYGSLTSIGESPLNPRVLYTGSDDGQLQVSRDGGATWTNITARVPALPPYTYVSAVVPSRYTAGRVYATFDGHYNDDYRPYVYVSDDYGQTWRSLAAGLPETSINRIREHPRSPRVLLLAHERGVHVSTDGGATWIGLSRLTNIPNVPVDDAVFQERDDALVLGTHGRGLWILDDASALATLTPDALRTDAVLLPMARAREWSTYAPQAWYGHGEFFAPNPDFDAVVRYSLRDAAAVTGTARIEITDAAGKTVRSLTGPAAAGLNRATWDMRMAPPYAEDSTAGGRGGAPGGGEGGGGRGGAPIGVRVLPGTYHVAVQVPGIARTLRGDLVVESDPLPNVTAADRATRFAFLTRMDLVSQRVAAARGAARTLASQREALQRDLAPEGGPTAATIDSLGARLGRLQSDAARQLAVLNQLSRAVDGFSGPPTLDQQRQAGWALDDATTLVRDVNRIITTDIPGLYAQIAKRPWPSPVPAVPAVPAASSARAPTSAGAKKKG